MASSARGTQTDQTKEPRQMMERYGLSGACNPALMDGRVGHKACGGWRCTCDCHDGADPSPPTDWAALASLPWRQVGTAVYAGDRLVYHGTVPPDDDGKARMVDFLAAATAKARAAWAAMRADVARYKAGQVADDAYFDAVVLNEGRTPTPDEMPSRRRVGPVPGGAGENPRNPLGSVD